METGSPISDADAIVHADATMEGPWRVFWRRLRKQRIATVGAVILGVLYLAAIFAGFVAPYDYEHYDRERLFHPPTMLRFAGWRLGVQGYEALPGDFKYRAVKGDIAPIHFFVSGDKYHLLGFIPMRVHLIGPSDAQHPIYLAGTDQYGRDIFSRLLYGSQISLSIGLVGICLSFSFGMVLGAIAGYFGGAPDSVIMRFCELIMSIPSLYLIIALRADFPPTLRSSTVYILIIVILSFIRWAATARVIRGMALSLRERQYVLAARTLGMGNWRVMMRHVLPGTFSYVIVAATLSVPYYILGEVVLSFLGVGIQEPDASWGIMLSEAQNPDYLMRFPWLLAPGVVIFVTVLAFNFLGDGLRDAVDAKS